MKEILIKSKQGNYTIIIQENLLLNIREYLNMNTKYVIISDDRIPKKYVELVKEACNNPLYISFPEGEKSKSFNQYEKIIDVLQKNCIKRDACIIALGGGVTGDLSGFVAATYLRGIDYIQVPTSLLAQIDSSVGGKVAINTPRAKNSVGNFYAPKLVLIDPTTLNTLENRHFNNGMAEMIKYGMIFSKKFFNEILQEDVKNNLEYFIYHSLVIKKHYVESDEFDKGLRQVLNYGHTYGHAYEAYYNFEKYLHGEGVALGMVKVCSNIKTKNKLIQVLNKYDLPVEDEVLESNLSTFIKNDKKQTKNHLNLILVEEIGKSKIEKVIL